MSNGASALVVCFYPSNSGTGRFVIVKFDFVQVPETENQFKIKFSETGILMQKKEVIRRGDLFLVNMFEDMFNHKQTLTITRDGLTPDYTQVLTLDFENGKTTGDAQINNYKSLFSNLPKDIRVVKADKRHLYIVSGDGSDPNDVSIAHGL